MFLFTEDKEVIIQKRSQDKFHNAGLLDKSIGGHISFGDTPFYTVMVETVQELKTPSIVLGTEEDFRKTYALLKNYVSTVAIIKQVDRKIIQPEKIIDGQKINIANDVYLFFGIYNGSIKPVDKEASGVLYYNLDTLEKEIKHNPDIFSEDLKYFLHHYNKEIKNFLESF